MATIPDQQSIEFFDSAWKNKNSGERLRAMTQLSRNHSEGQQALIQIALHDEHVAVRIGALKHVHDLDVLVELRDRQGPLQESAAHQYLRVLAGSHDSDISEAQRLQSIRSLPKAGLKQVALLAKSKTAGSEALNLIDEPEELMDLSLFAASVHVRKNAALKITDKALLLELRKKVQNKDKTVFKVVDRRISAQADNRKPGEASQTGKNPKSKKTKPAAVIAKSKTAPVQKSPKRNAKPEIGKLETADIKTQDVRTKAPETPEPKSKGAKTPAPEAIDPEVQLPRLEAELSKTSYKNTGRLNSLRADVNSLRKAVAHASEEVKEKTNSMHNALLEMQEKNRSHQEHLKEVTESLLLLLAKALEDGQSHAALPAWDKIQGNISNTSGKLRAALQKQANNHKDKLNELRDWKIFASTEKKKDLVTQMQHLIESKMHAADKSKHISNMHRQWKALGRSSQNEALWREFKKLSDKAYEPCKDYFKQRKQLMASNLKQRRGICDRLEQELKTLAEENLNISNLNTLLRDAENEWKQFAPVEHSRIKSLQKRYYGLVNQFRKQRKNASRTNSKQKQEYITQARSLADMEDNNSAMSEAKRLQQQWKKLGPTSYKEDKKFWEDFRAACDKIFAKRNQQTAESRKQLQQAEGSLEKILQSMATVFELDDDSFRKSRTDYQDLIQQFSTAMDPRIKTQRKRLLDQFNGLKRKIDSRFNTLPNKKAMLLKNAVLAKSKFLEQLEDKLLNSKDDEQFNELKNQIDRKAWEDIEPANNLQYEEALRDRLGKIIATASFEDLRNLAPKC
ncbi:MAG: DUF349 domain-containing protein, partial [Proteobacteria bacterium]|nr:DUF349 domain-containing protein [Pseudomonadota bacterium]